MSPGGEGETAEGSELNAEGRAIREVEFWVTKPPPPRKEGSRNVKGLGTALLTQNREVADLVLSGGRLWGRGLWNGLETQGCYVELNCSELRPCGFFLLSSFPSSIEGVCVCFILAYMVRCWRR